uniref:Uncharacterized protein n=1 Tax=Pectinophora gossypiella TaxID=13191 RepID=A0A1E1W6B5_PECGO
MTTIISGDLCMINANVFKSTNKKFVVHEVHERPLRPVPQLPPAVVLPEEPENEQRVEELIQNSGNVVLNIQDITLKEAAIPDFQLPPNDGFGEEHPDQALQSLLGDRTVEMMMAPEMSAPHVSGLDLPADVTDKSHDRSRLPHDAPQMEAVAELDVTVFRKSTAEDLLPAFEKGM